MDFHLPSLVKQDKSLERTAMAPVKSMACDRGVLKQ